MLVHLGENNSLAVAAMFDYNVLRNNQQVVYIPQVHLQNNNRRNFA